MGDDEDWGQKDFSKEALRLCSLLYTPPFGNRDYADPSSLVDAYDRLKSTPLADRLSIAVAELLDYKNADVRVVAAYFFATHPTAAGSERLLDVIENGPCSAVTVGDGDVWPWYQPNSLRSCFQEALTTIAASGHPRAISLLTRNDIRQLLQRASR